MRTFNSVVQQRGAVPFATHINERVYMQEFYKHAPLPTNLHRWAKTLDAMLDGVDTDGPMYLMIDQGVVRAGTSQRRPGVHIDGYWVPSIQAHGGGRHEGRWDNGGGWNTAGFVEKEGILLASSVQAAQAFSGDFAGQPGEGGDCSHIDIGHLSPTTMLAGSVYAGNVTMLHESLPVAFDTLRTLVRINVPGWHPN